MNSNMDSTLMKPQTRERGRSMRNFGKGLLKGLALVLAITPVAVVFAATSVTGIEHAGTEDGGVSISLETSGDVPQVSVFATESPARIVLDLADTAYSAGESGPIFVGQGSVQQYSAISAGGRTRLVVDLSNAVTYDYSADAGQVVLTHRRQWSHSHTGPASAMAGNTGYNVTGVDFRRGEEGQARIIVSLDKPGASMSVREVTNGLTLDIFDASLPESLDHRLDVMDFATPVQFIDSYGVNSGVRLDISTAGLYEHLAYEVGQRHRCRGQRHERRQRRRSKTSRSSSSRTRTTKAPRSPSISRTSRFARCCS